MIVSCRDVAKSFGSAEVLRNVSFRLEDGEKAAIVGANGAGKTTLLKILTGELARDDGELAVRRGATVGFLSQMTELDPAKGIEAELLSVFAPLMKMEAELRALEAQMADGAAEAVMARYDQLSRAFEAAEGYAFRSRTRGVLAGLGFKDEELKLPIGRLSGGQKTRVSLGKLLLTAPDLLLLDEPTNHLDVPSVMWLEDTFLRGFPGSVLVVSHDRYFLDKVATKIIDIENGTAAVYQGNYTFFAAQKEIDREVALKRYLDQQKVIAKQEETIRVLRSFNREKSIRRAESREKMLAKLTRVEKPQDAPKRIHIEFEPRVQSGKDVLMIDRAEKSFGARQLFRDVSFTMRRGEIAALVGPNGVGKTTLFNMILRGERGIRLGENVKIGWFDQEYATLTLSNTLYDEVADAYPKLTVTEIRGTLAAFGFTGDDAFKRVEALSGGEKGRVLLAKLMLGNANFLMLDEPTNHLDMFSKEILEEALRGYAGTVLYISHDRYFINNTADRVIELSPDGAAAYLGDYDHYAEKRLSPEAQKPDAPISEAAAARADKKAGQAAERKRQSQIAALEKEIAEIERKITEIDAALLTEAVYMDYERARDLSETKEQLEARLEAAYAEWDGLHG